MISFRNSYKEKINSYELLKINRDMHFLDALNSIQTNIENDFSKYLDILDLIKKYVHIDTYLSLKIGGTGFNVLFFNSHLSGVHKTHKRKRNVVFLYSNINRYNEPTCLLQISKLDDLESFFNQVIYPSIRTVNIPNVFSKSFLNTKNKHQIDFCLNFISKYEQIKQEIDSFFENIIKNKTTILSEEIDIFNNFSSMNKPIKKIKAETGIKIKI